MGPDSLWPDTWSFAFVRVAICLTTPPDIYSGGRYAAFMLAEALACGGHEAYVVADNEPIFFTDFEDLPHHKDVHFWRTSDFRSDMPKGRFDIVVLIPGTSRPGFYLRVELFALERDAHLVFFNFETPNWYNKLSPTPRPLSDWAPWERSSRSASLILSISNEGTRWSREFYQRTLPEARFEFAYPCINTAAADAATPQIREDRLLLFMRFTASKHKGSEQLDRLFCEAMRGYTLVIILGKDDIPPPVLKQLAIDARKFGVELELRHKLSDREKFKEIARARLMLFPSLFEGFGYPPVEALYCNTPCVAFDLPVLREICKDHLLYAEHNNWEDFREQISATLAKEPQDVNTHSEVARSVSPQSLADRLSELFTPLIGTPSLSRQSHPWRLAWLRIRSGLRLSDPKYRYRLLRSLVKKTAFKMLGTMVRSTHELRRRRRRVVFYPPFASREELTNHYHRAAWYLPRVAGRCEEVCLFHDIQGSDVAPGPAPKYMGQPPKPTRHIRLIKGRFKNLRMLLAADLILFWQEDPSRKLMKFLDRVFGIKSAHVATEDLTANEYDEYCRSLWEYLTLEKERKSIIQSNRLRLERLVSELERNPVQASCVFGTGPSLAKAYDFDFSRTLCIVCNSIVRDEKLLNHIRPRFICAGDAVSHFGVSAYAFQFRKDLIRAIETRDLYLFTTAKVGALLLHHYPELTDKVFLIEQTRDEPTFNFTKHYEAARLDSTLNIHMLPLASTFSQTVFLLGCDGKNPNGENEDFWAHADEAQYRSLVASGHECHPTFDLLRRMSTYEHYLRSLETTVAGGEERGIRYHSLHNSFTKVLNERVVSQREMEEFGLQKPYGIAELAQRFHSSK